MLLTTLKMRMNCTERLDEGSAVSSSAALTMRHMWTRIEGKGTHDMTYQNTAWGVAGGRGELTLACMHPLLCGK